jgi:hypothetical protein
VKKFAIVVGAIVGFIAVVGTALYLLAQPLPSALILDDTCHPPCWLGIRPGGMSPWGVFQILVDAPFVDQSSIRQGGDPGATEHIAWRFRRPAGDLAGYVYFDTERVSYLRILTLGAMNLGEALRKYGEPDAFWLQTRGRPSEAWTQLNIIYPEIGCVLEIRFDYTGKAAPNRVALSEHTPVRAVTYFDPSSTRALFPIAADELHEWNGLGQIEVTTRPE